MKKLLEVFLMIIRLLSFLILVITLTGCNGISVEKQEQTKEKPVAETTEKNAKIETAQKKSDTPPPAKRQSKSQEVKSVDLKNLQEVWSYKFPDEVTDVVFRTERKGAFPLAAALTSKAIYRFERSGAPMTPEMELKPEQRAFLSEQASKAAVLTSLKEYADDESALDISIVDIFQPDRTGSESILIADPKFSRNLNEITCNFDPTGKWFSLVSFPASQIRLYHVNGAALNSLEVPGMIKIDSLFNQNGDTYIASVTSLHEGKQKSEVLAFNNKGKRIWRFNGFKGVPFKHAVPLLYPEDKRFALVSDNAIYCFDQNFDILWKVPTWIGTFKAAVSYAKPAVLFAADEEQGALFLFNAMTGKLIEKKDLNPYIKRPRDRFRQMIPFSTGVLLAVQRGAKNLTDQYRIMFFSEKGELIWEKNMEPNETNLYPMPDPNAFTTAAGNKITIYAPQDH